MTDYTIKASRVPDDVPEDVVLDAVSVALRKLNKDRKAFKRIRVELIDKEPTRKGRAHPFDGPEVNDDLPLATGGYTSGTMQPVYDGSYVIPKSAISTYWSGVPIFTGPNRDDEDWADVGIVAQVPEAEVEVIELDLDGIISEVYRAIGEDFPRLAELFKAKADERELHRPADATEPPAEGDWELPSDDKVGDDL